MGFSKDSQRLLAVAAMTASGLGDDFVGPQHLLYALAVLPPAIVEDELVALKKAIVQVQPQADLHERAISGEQAMESAIPHTPILRRILDRAHEEANRLNRKDVGPEHILLGIAAQEGCIATQVLSELGITLEEVTRRIAFGL